MDIERETRYHYQKQHPQDEAAVVDAHAADIIHRLGGTEAIDDLAYLAWQDRATPARLYWADVARQVAAMTGQDDRRAAQRFYDIGAQANAAYWKERAGEDEQQLASEMAVSDMKRPGDAY
jgi:hypothetical protein